MQKPVVRPASAGDRIDEGLRLALVVTKICALAAKCALLLLVLYLLGSILFGLVAHADTDRLGTLICKGFYDGMSFDDIVPALQHDNPGWDENRVRWTVAAAIMMQCPSQAGKLPGDIQDSLTR